MLFLLVLLVKQILDKPLSHLFSVRLWVHSSYDEFFGQWWHMGYISWAGCLTLPCWYERSGSGSSSCGTSEECFPCAEENIKIHFCGIAVRSFSHFFKYSCLYNSYLELINLCFIKSKTSHTASHNFSIYEDCRGFGVMRIFSCRKKLFFCEIGNYYIYAWVVLSQKLRK